MILNDFRWSDGVWRDGAQVVQHHRNALRQGASSISFYHF